MSDQACHIEAIGTPQNFVASREQDRKAPKLESLSGWRHTREFALVGRGHEPPPEDALAAGERLASRSNGEVGQGPKRSDEMTADLFLAQHNSAYAEVAVARIFGEEGEQPVTVMPIPGRDVLSD